MSAPVCGAPLAAPLAEIRPAEGLAPTIRAEFRALFPYTPRMFECDMTLAGTVNTDSREIARGLRRERYRPLARAGWTISASSCSLFHLLAWAERTCRRPCTGNVVTGSGTRRDLRRAISLRAVAIRRRPQSRRRSHAQAANLQPRLGWLSGTKPRIHSAHFQ